MLFFNYDFLIEDLNKSFDDLLLSLKKITETNDDEIYFELFKQFRILKDCCCTISKVLSDQNEETYILNLIKKTAKISLLSEVFVEKIREKEIFVSTSEFERVFDVIKKDLLNLINSIEKRKRNSKKLNSILMLESFMMN